MKKKSIIFLMVLLLVCSLSISLFACEKDEAPSYTFQVSGIEGQSSAVVNVEAKEISLKTDHNLATLPIASIKAGEGVEVNAYSDSDKKNELKDVLPIAYGENTFYLTLSYTNNGTVFAENWTLKVTKAKSNISDVNVKELTIDYPVTARKLEGKLEAKKDGEVNIYDISTLPIVNTADIKVGEVDIVLDLEGTDVKVRVRFNDAVLPTYPPYKYNEIDYDLLVDAMFYSVVYNEENGDMGIQKREFTAFANTPENKEELLYQVVSAGVTNTDLQLFLDKYALRVNKTLNALNNEPIEDPYKQYAMPFMKDLDNYLNSENLIGILSLVRDMSKDFSPTALTNFLISSELSIESSVKSYMLEDTDDVKVKENLEKQYELTMRYASTYTQRYLRTEASYLSQIALATINDVFQNTTPEELTSAIRFFFDNANDVMLDMMNSPSFSIDANLTKIGYKNIVSNFKTINLLLVSLDKSISGKTFLVNQILDKIANDKAIEGENIAYLKPALNALLIMPDILDMVDENVLKRVAVNADTMMKLDKTSNEYAIAKAKAIIEVSKLSDVVMATMTSVELYDLETFVNGIFNMRSIDLGLAHMADEIDYPTFDELVAIKDAALAIKKPEDITIDEATALNKMLSDFTAKYADDFAFVPYDSVEISGITRVVDKTISDEDLIEHLKANHSFYVVKNISRTNSKSTYINDSSLVFPEILPREAGVNSINVTTTYEDKTYTGVYKYYIESENEDLSLVYNTEIYVSDSYDKTYDLAYNKDGAIAISGAIPYKFMRATFRFNILSQNVMYNNAIEYETIEDAKLYNVDTTKIGHDKKGYIIFDVPVIGEIYYPFYYNVIDTTNSELAQVEADETYYISDLDTLDESIPKAVRDELITALTFENVNFRTLHKNSSIYGKAHVLLKDIVADPTKLTSGKNTIVYNYTEGNVTIPTNVIVNKITMAEFGNILMNDINSSIGVEITDICTSYDVNSYVKQYSEVYPAIDITSDYTDIFIEADLDSIAKIFNALNMQVDIKLPILDMVGEQNISCKITKKSDPTFVVNELNDKILVYNDNYNDLITEMTINTYPLTQGGDIGITENDLRIMKYGNSMEKKMLIRKIISRDVDGITLNTLGNGLFTEKKDIDHLIDINTFLFEVESYGSTYTYITILNEYNNEIYSNRYKIISENDAIPNDVYGQNSDLIFPANATLQDVIDSYGILFVSKFYYNVFDQIDANIVTNWNVTLTRTLTVTNNNVNENINPLASSLARGYYTMRTNVNGITDIYTFYIGNIYDVDAYSSNSTTLTTANTLDELIDQIVIKTIDTDGRLETCALKDDINNVVDHYTITCDGVNLDITSNAQLTVGTYSVNVTFVENSNVEFVVNIDVLS